MYPELYQRWFKLTAWRVTRHALNPSELVLVEILMRMVGLLSKATLGHLANNLPLPILAASRLKTLRKDSGLESLSAIEHGYTFEAILLNIL